eukprot:8199919-Pyramimonas_sp.AAC.1
MGRRATARSKDIKHLGSVAHYSRCPRSAVGRHPLAALFIDGRVDLRLRRDMPMRRVPATPSLEGVVHQRPDRVGKRLLVEGEADAPGVLGHHVRVGIASSGCPRIARGRLSWNWLCISYLHDEHGRFLALRIGCDSERR